jgi:sec-independent protein translocase protein TatC
LSDQPSESLASMPFMQHLGELRKVLIAVGVVLVIGIACAWYFSDDILSLITKLLPEGAPAHIFSPPEAFMIRLKVSAAVALFIGVPFILYRIWSFVAPALYGHEKKRLQPLFIISTLLFYTGTTFSYVVITPITISYFYRLMPPDVVMTVGASSLFAMVAKLSVAFGIVFQLPLIIFVLTLMGVVSPRWLVKKWRIAFMVMLVFSAVLTPPDVISQMAMTIPLFVLFVISCLISMVVERKKKGKSDNIDSE